MRALAAPRFELFCCGAGRIDCRVEERVFYSGMALAVSCRNVLRPVARNHQGKDRDHCQQHAAPRHAAATLPITGRVVFAKAMPRCLAWATAFSLRFARVDIRTPMYKQSKHECVAAALRSTGIYALCS